MGKLSADSDVVLCRKCVGPLFDNEHAISCLPCGHVFHRICVKIYTRGQGHCPICRKFCTKGQVVDKLMFSTLKDGEKSVVVP